MATGSNGAGRHMSGQETGEPSEFVALADRGAEDPFDEYERVLTSLCRLTGGEVPARLGGNRRSWQGGMRQAITNRLPRLPDEVIRYRLPEEPSADSLLELLVRAAVYEPSLSFSKHLVQPATVVFGNRRVRAAVLQYLRNGSDYERAGAARVWIWTQARLCYVGASSTPTPESVEAAQALTDQDREFQETALEVFVTSNDVEVRRSIVWSLDLHVQRWPEEWQDLVYQAIRIADTHADDLYT